MPFASFLFAVLFLTIGGSAYGQSDSPVAPLLEDLGTLHHPVTTDSERAQIFFDQGLRLTYAFNHAEAARAFREAALSTRS